MIFISFWDGPESSITITNNHYTLQSIWYQLTIQVLNFIIWMVEHKQINNIHSEGKYMGKNLHGKYLDTVGNIGVKLPLLCWVRVLGLYEYILFIIYFHQIMWGGKEKGKEHLILFLKIMCRVLVKLRAIQITLIRVLLGSGKMGDISSFRE